MENILRYLLSSNHYHGMPWKSNSHISAKTWKQLIMFEERNFHSTFVLKLWCRKEAAQLSQIPQFSQPPAVWKGTDPSQAVWDTLWLQGALGFCQYFGLEVGCCSPPSGGRLFTAPVEHYSIKGVVRGWTCWESTVVSFSLHPAEQYSEVTSEPCWSSSSTRNKAANTFVVDKLAHIPPLQVRRP